MLQSLTIGKLAKKAAVSIYSIRFYERRGLLAERIFCMLGRSSPLKYSISKVFNLPFWLAEVKLCGAVPVKIEAVQTE